MKRLVINAFIFGYLGVLGFGVFSHTMKFHNASHPAMYYVVWDMFCGWSAFSTRIHIVGEGESGAYYDLSHGPWGEFTPYSNLDRRHYDYRASNLKNIAGNVLRQTEHEEIVRVYTIEENWPKKYNMPDYIWNRLYDEPREFQSYYNIRLVLDGEAEIVQSNPCWQTRCARTAYTRRSSYRNSLVNRRKNERFMPRVGHEVETVSYEEPLGETSTDQDDSEMIFSPSAN